MSTGQTQKYLLYAIGEISLVVVGILIALQVNNWNEQRKIDTLENEYLQGLQDEFVMNLRMVERLMNQNNINLKHALMVADLIGPDPIEIPEDSIALLLASSLQAELQFRPSSGILTEIISSGKLSIFNNNDLKKSLASWEGLLQKVRFQEDEEHGRIRKRIFNLLMEQGNFRMLATASLGDSFGFGPTRFKPNNFRLLSSQRFENELIGFIATGRYLNDGYYADLKSEIEFILSIIDLELKAN